MDRLVGLVGFIWGIPLVFLMRGCRGLRIHRRCMGFGLCRAYSIHWVCIVYGL